MHKNEFYEGLKFELEKLADIKPPFQPTLWNNTKNLTGKALGWTSNLTENHPVLTSSLSSLAGPIGSPLKLLSNENFINKNFIDPNINSAPFKYKPNPLAQGFLSTNPRGVNHIQNTLNPTYYGFEQYDPKSGSVRFNFNNGMSYLGSHIGDFLKNNWGKLAGGAGIIGLLAMLMKSNNSQQPVVNNNYYNQQSPPISHSPQYFNNY